ncbi:hypothetical protein GCM10027046_12710 [Uliginosibacterium flavum]
MAVCSGTDWFCDDFQNGSSANWDLGITNAGTAGGFSVIDEPGAPSNKVMYYDAQVDTKGGVIAALKDSVWAGVSNKTNYYVEARIKPLANGTSGNKQLYLLARYGSATSWYHGGLNMQGLPTATKVEEGVSNASFLPSRAKQVSKALVMGAAPTSADLTTWVPGGQWYTVRFELIGSDLVTYVDGEKVAVWADTSITGAGKIALWSANRSFLIDDVKVGDPSVKPVALVLAPSALTYTAEAGTAPYSVAVTALKSDGTTADTFSVSSSNTAVVSVVTSGTTVTLTPVAAGTANVTFISGSDSTVKRTIAVTINPGFVMPTATYGSLAAKTVPASGAAAAYADEVLSLTFDSVPVLGSVGSVRIFDSSNDLVVDTIGLAGESNAVGPAVGGYYRGLAMPMISVSGNSLKIRPHMNKLAYGKTYYVAVANGVVAGTLNGTSFSGLGKTANWSFTTKAAPASGLTSLTVDDDGVADFRTVQGALNYVMANVAVDTAATITVKNGTYEELLYLRGKNKLTIQGESRAGSVITFNNYDGLNVGNGAGVTSSTVTSGGGRGVFLIDGTTDELTLDNLTFKNTRLRTGGGDQAETILFNSDGRLVAKNSNFLSEQDTLQLKGYSWFYNSLVAGNTDFIWGYIKAAVFENSEIRTVGDSKPSTTSPSGGYVAVTRTAPGDKGLVFLNSKFTYGPSPSASGQQVANGTNAPAATYLARSQASTGVGDKVAYIGCKMDTHIAAYGWADATINGQVNPDTNPATAAAGWREYGSTDLNGTALNVSARSATSLQLSAGDAGALDTRAEIFSGFSGGWNPQP